VGVTVLLADDHPVFRQGLRMLLERERFEILGEAAIGRTGSCSGLWQGAVEVEDALDVGGHGLGFRSEGPSMRRVWQRCLSRLSRASTMGRLPRK